MSRHKDAMNDLKMKEPFLPRNFTFWRQICASPPSLPLSSLLPICADWQLTPSKLAGQPYCLAMWNLVWESRWDEWVPFSSPFPRVWARIKLYIFHVHGSYQTLHFRGNPSFISDWTQSHFSLLIATSFILEIWGQHFFKEDWLNDWRSSLLECLVTTMQNEIWSFFYGFPLQVFSYDRLVGRVSKLA